jgi:hypothetical protein
MFQIVKFMIVEEEINKGLFFGIGSSSFDGSAFFSLGASAFPLRLMKFFFWIVLKSQ